MLLELPPPPVPVTALSVLGCILEWVPCAALYECEDVNVNVDVDTCRPPNEHPFGPRFGATRPKNLFVRASGLNLVDRGRKIWMYIYTDGCYRSMATAEWCLRHVADIVSENWPGDVFKDPRVPFFLALLFRLFRLLCL
jgi:hypothetical protein